MKVSRGNISDKEVFVMILEKIVPEQELWGQLASLMDTLCVNDHRYTTLGDPHWQTGKGHQIILMLGAAFSVKICLAAHIIANDSCFSVPVSNGREHGSPSRKSGGRLGWSPAPAQVLLFPPDPVIENPATHTWVHSREPPWVQNR